MDWLSRITEIVHGTESVVTCCVSSCKCPTDFPQTAAKLQMILLELYDTQQNQPLEFDSTNYRIIPKGQQDRSRRRRLAAYVGPDELTIQFLELHAAEFSARPERFWQKRLQALDLSSSNAMASIVKIYDGMECDIV